MVFWCVFCLQTRASLTAAKEEEDCAATEVGHLDVRQLQQAVHDETAVLSSMSPAGLQSACDAAFRRLSAGNDGVLQQVRLPVCLLHPVRCVKL